MREASEPSGSCGFTGKLTIEVSGCSKVGTTGININKYCVTIEGTMEGPVGASWDLNTDPANTINEACGQPIGCDAWKSDVCKRGPSDPAATKFTWSYEFGSDQASIIVKPRVDLSGPNGDLDNKDVSVTCKAQ